MYLSFRFFKRYPLSCCVWLSILMVSIGGGGTATAGDRFEPSSSCKFEGEAGIQIACAQLLRDGPADSIVLLPGYSESLRKYDEVARDFFKSGYSVFILDHRGQGDSGRLLRDKRVAQIDHFEFLTADVHRFVELRVKPQTKGRLYLLGHSLGGAIGADYIERYPNDFRKAVLVAPMLGINLGRWPSWAAKVLLRIFSMFGQADEVLFALKDPALYPFENNELTHSLERFRADQMLILEHPGISIWGRSRRWLAEALFAEEQIAQQAHLIRTPILLFQAQEDSFVTSEAQADFCASAQECSLVNVKRAKHEILREVDSVRAPVLQTILNFLADGKAAGATREGPEH